MSCGTKINSHDRYGLSEALEREGEYGLARDVCIGECLDRRSLLRAEDALERQGMRRHLDYREDNCHCSDEYE